MSCSAREGLSHIEMMKDCNETPYSQELNSSGITELGPRDPKSGALTTRPPRCFYDLIRPQMSHIGLDKSGYQIIFFLFLHRSR